MNLFANFRGLALGCIEASKQASKNVRSLSKAKSRIQILVGKRILFRGGNELESYWRDLSDIPASFERTEPRLKMKYMPLHLSDLKILADVHYECWWFSKCLTRNRQGFASFVAILAEARLLFDHLTNFVGIPETIQKIENSVKMPKMILWRKPLEIDNKS